MVLDEIINADPLGLTLSEHVSDHTPQVITVEGGDPLEVALLDLYCEAQLVLGLEGRPQAGHLVDETAE